MHARLIYREAWRRATILAGVAQPLAPRDAIAHMPKGYLFNAVHRVAFDAAKPVHCNRLN